jgi:hypothetical protein
MNISMPASRVLQYFIGKCSHCSNERPEYVIEVYPTKQSQRIEYWCLSCVYSYGKMMLDRKITNLSKTT